ncbi:MAG: methylated-DNA--[protein]-cysteine S-methyltransferase [Planctomycetota bacterium]|nr:MAG: methylated-DNA--[protein]-cysteine S-methyltransferase [Planctomycetota bacterium]
MNLRYRVVKTDLGWCGFVASARGLRALILPKRSAEVVRRTIRTGFADAREDRALLPEFAAQLRDYCAGKPVSFDVPLDLPHASEFHYDVWQACMRVPYGETVSYGELARRVGHPGAARAVGTAMRRNPVPLVVPCHRVVKSDGGLGGYSGTGGVTMKERLLEMESAALTPV